MGCSHLPVLGLALEHDGVFRLVNVIWVLVLDLLDVGLSLDAVILGECALVTLLNRSVSIGRMVRVYYRVTYSAGISQKVVADRLDVAVGGCAELADRLEVLLASPPLRQNWQRDRDLHVGCHCVVFWWGRRRRCR
jgi:hypothetical protein